MKFSPEKLLRSRNSVMKSVFENFDSFMVKIRVKGHSLVLSEVKVGLKILVFKSYEIFTRKALEDKKFCG